MATTQQDIDRLQAELERLRALMIRDRDAATDQIGDLLDRARTMRDEAAGGKYEVAVQCVNDLLGSLQRGLNAQRNVTQAAESLRQ